jgi:hypothetical protein
VTYAINTALKLRMRRKKKIPAEVYVHKISGKGKTY